MIPASVIKAVVGFATVLAACSGASPAAAQQAATDVGHVEAVSGRVAAIAGGTRVLVSILDVVGDRTRFDLPAGSELRLCHHGMRRLLTMTGPARVTVSADSITVEAGKAVAVSHDTCVVAQASKFQGGFVARGVPAKK
jgi:hypothetical protein